eukprot:TRINITY_DN16431_c0_g1_i1.p1 TRINITY_DN16431_c0_g1~~TRINITY_DN16431_c0_g1_i1.p1  ORF type:complete len:739 (+),score=69.95 TRINITY_DN16431_c0_g1_i1:183-2399(+)
MRAAAGRQYDRSWTAALSQLVERLQSGWKPDVISLLKAVDPAKRAAEWRCAQHLLAAAAKLVVETDTVVNNGVISSCDKARCWVNAVAQLQSIALQGLQATVVSYSAVASSFVESSAWRKGLRLVEQASSTQVQVNAVMYNPVVNSCGRSAAWCTAVALVLGMTRMHVSPTTSTFNVAVAALKEGTLWVVATALLETMLEGRVAGDAITYNNMLTTFSGDVDISQALGLLRDLRRRADVEVDCVSHTVLMGLTDTRGSWTLSVQLLSDCLNDAIVPDTYLYTKLARSCTRGRCWLISCGFIHHIGCKHVRANAIVYSAITTVDDEDVLSTWGEALVAAHLSDLSTSGLRPDSLLQNVAMSASASSMAWTRACCMLSSVTAASCKTTSMCMGAIATKCASAAAWATACSGIDTFMGCELGDESADETAEREASSLTLLNCLSHSWTEALCALKSALLRGFRVGVIPRSSVLEGTKAAAHWRLVLEHVREFSCQEVDADTKAYNVALSACGYDEHWQTASWLLTQLHLSRLQPTLVSWNTVLHGMRNLDPKQSSTTLGAIHASGLVADVASYGSLLSACEHSAEWQMAIMQLRQALDRNVEVASQGFNTAVRCSTAAGSWSAATAILQTVLCRRVRLDSHAYWSRVTAQEMQTSWASTLLQFSRLESLAVQSDAFLLNAAVESVAANGRWIEALSLVDNTRGSSGLHNEITYSVTAAACERASAWFPSLWLMGSLKKDAG